MALKNFHSQAGKDGIMTGALAKGCFSSSQNFWKASEDLGFVKEEKISVAKRQNGSQKETRETPFFKFLERVNPVTALFPSGK